MHALSQLLLVAAGGKDPPSLERRQLVAQPGAVLQADSRRAFAAKEQRTIAQQHVGGADDGDPSAEGTVARLEAAAVGDDEAFELKADEAHWRRPREEAEERRARHHLQQLHVAAALNAHLARREAAVDL